MKNTIKSAVLAIAGLVSLSGEVRATLAFTFGLDQEFSGGTAPASPSTPWTDVTFSSLSGGAVQLTIRNPNLTGTENVAGLYLNFDDSLNVGNLSFTYLSQSGSFTGPTIDRSQNQYKADGDGRYDIRLNFTTGGNVSQTFGGTEELIYRLEYPGGIDETDFLFFSQPAGGHGPFYAAAHVQNTPGGNSGWISADSFVVVPEPATLGAGLACARLLLGATALRRREAGR